MVFLLFVGANKSSRRKWSSYHLATSINYSRWHLRKNIWYRNEIMTHKSLLYMFKLQHQLRIRKLVKVRRMKCLALSLSLIEKIWNMKLNIHISWIISNKYNENYVLLSFITYKKKCLFVKWYQLNVIIFSSSEILS